jgi:hypothetical protein
MIGYFWLKGSVNLSQLNCIEVAWEGVFKNSLLDLFHWSVSLAVLLFKMSGSLNRNALPSGGQYDRMMGDKTKVGRSFTIFFVDEKKIVASSIL